MCRYVDGRSMWWLLLNVPLNLCLETYSYEKNTEKELW
jgi:hypothetical protein